MTDAFSGDFDAALEGLRAEAVREEEASQRHAELVVDYIGYLSERGVYVDLDPSPAGTESRDAMDLVLLACVQDAIENPIQGQQFDPNAKKILQATFLTAGRSNSWIELVDIALPGEPFDITTDSEIVADVMKRSLTQISESILPYTNAVADIEKLIGREGLSEAEEEAIAELAYLLAESRKANAPKGSQFLEGAILILSNLGLAGEEWEKLLDLYFRPDAE